MKKKKSGPAKAIVARGAGAKVAKGKAGSGVTVSVIIGGKKKKEKAAAGTTAQSLADRHGLNGQTFFIKINGKLAHPSTVLKEGDVVEFVGIIYGG